MPYQIRKVRGKELFSVKNAETGKIHAHATTKANAKKQVKLLQAIDHGFVPSKDELEGAGFGETLVNLYNRIRGHRGAQVAPAPPDNINPMGPLAPVNRTPEHNNQGNQVVPEFITADKLFGPSSRGSGRMNPAVQTMLTYLKSLYPKKTLTSVANEILKLTGQKMSGRGRKSPTVTEIAKYVIGAIGSALAIALALFLLNNEIQKGKENDYKNAVNQMEIDRQRRINIEAENKKPKSKPFGQNFAGGVRLNSAAKSMITYLKSLYPSKTLHSVANEILKITGHKVGGIRGGKSKSASEIAKYVIGAIGVALAVAVAIFLLNQDKKEEELGSPIKIKSEIFNEPERKRIVSVFDNPNSEEYKQRELFKEQAKQPLQIPEKKITLTKPISTPPKPVSKSKGPSESYKQEVERVKERLAELDKKKKEEDRQKLMKHLYDDFDGRKPHGSGRKKRLRKKKNM